MSKAYVPSSTVLYAILRAVFSFHRAVFRIPLSALILAVIFTGGQNAHAADFSVNSVADKIDAAPGDGICSTGSMVDGQTAECTLRAAIDEVNALAKAKPGAAYTVSVPEGTYYLTVVEACPYYDAGNPNQLSMNAITLCISGNLTLTGADPSTTIIDGGQIDRIFFVSAGFTAAINNLTIQHGSFAKDIGSFDGIGGGINNQGTLTVTNDVFTMNSANTSSHLGGGAIYNAGTLVVQSCSFINNTDVALMSEYATANINLSYFSQNSGLQGSAVYSFVGTLNISNSTFVNNTVDENAIIAAFNTPATITNSTISNNTITSGGAIKSYGNGSSITLNNDTIYGNISGPNGLIGGLDAENASIANTILAGNTPTDCTVVSLVNYGHNIIQTADFVSLCKGGQNSTTLTGADPKLGPLTFHGGIFPTQTPLPDSPAIGAGSDVTPGSNSVSACTALDQRGFVRGASGACTIGAVEVDHGSQTPTILPASHGASGTVTAVIYGRGFSEDTTVEFQLSGKPALTPVQTAVDPGTNAITVTLNLNGVAPGKYDVVVTSPGGQSITLPAAYTVETPAAPDLYFYAIGPEAARAGRPAFYSFVYGNRGNVDAYLVPLTMSIPGGYAGLISSSVLAPPATAGQVIHDFADVHVEVAPYSTTSFTNVPLLVPVIPAGSQGVLMFSITPPPGTHGGATYTYSAYLGDPYGQGSDGSASASVVADLVSGAQTFAETFLGVKLSSQNLASMTAYATAQLAQELSEGKEALLESAQGEPIFFSTAQLSVDVAAYGASLANGGTAPAIRPAQRKVAVNLRPRPQDSQQGGGPKLVPCHKGQVMEEGTSCDANATPAPTRDPDPKRDGTVSRNTCLAIPNHHLSADGQLCVPNDRKGCPLIQNPFYTDPFCGTFKIATGIDPNEKDGPIGQGSAHFVLGGDPSGYQIEFENEATANAAAQTVVVTDPLDTSKYDLSTFQLGPISFGKYLLTPSPGLKNYSAALDLRPDMNITVVVKAGIDTSTGIATWTFNSLDPVTMKDLTDPFAGFLPPDTTPPVGIGHAAFSIQPLASVESGTQLCNTASVVFDTNAAIQTNSFCNTKDTTAPVSSVEPLSPTQSPATFTVSWTGTDAGVGIDHYDIYVSDNGGAFTPWQTMTTATSASYTGTIGHTYAFFSTAADRLGNVETKIAADTTTTVGTAPTPQATLSPTSLSFGAADVGSTTAAQTLKLSNPGSASLTISSIAITGTSAGEFHYTSVCGTSLAAGANCAISVVFAPTAAGNASATLTVTDAVGTQSAGLSGTGTSPSAPRASLTPASANFGSITTGSTSAAQTFTLSNAGNAVLSITSTGISGANAASFKIGANTCGSSLAAGANCTIAVTFGPTATGSASASLTVTDTVGTQSAVLTGTGTSPPAPKATLTPASASFGNVNVGSTSSPQTFTLANAGNAALPITSISIGGTNASAFTIGMNTCSSTLAVGGSCSIGVSFKPSTAGGASASLSVTDSVGTQSAPLSGTGVAIVPADFSLTADPATQDARRGSSVRYTIRLLSTVAGNAFGTPVTFAATGLPAGVTASFSPPSLVPGIAQAATSTMTVTVPDQSAKLTGASRQVGTISAAISLAGLILLWPRRCRRRPFNLFVLLIIAGLACATGLTACGGRAVSGSTSTITVTGSSGSTTHSVTVTLKVD